MTQPATGSRYRELDALRGIAALAVVFFHFTMFRSQAELGYNMGVTGVDLFFIISGFVIFMTVNKVSSPLEFAINRISRLYPTYWTCVTITFLVAIVNNRFFSATGDIAFPSYLANMTMFQNYFRVLDLDGSYWTMTVEMLFYIFIAGVFITKKLKYILPIGATILLLELMNDVWLSRYFPITNKIHVLLPLFTHFPLFFAGIIYYKLHEEKSGKKMSLYYALLVASYVVMLLLFDNGGRSQYFIPLYKYAIALFSYFLIFQLFISKKLGFIVNRPLLFLGKISYSLYLIHQYIGIKFLIPILTEYGHLGFWTAAFVTLPIVILLATGITYFVEIPLGGRMKDYLRSRFGIIKPISLVTVDVKNVGIIK